MMRIGVDVGGTNTDAVIIANDKILGFVKRPTSDDVHSGIYAAISDLLARCDVQASDIQNVMIGTTHFTNAFVQRKQLAKIFALRLGYPASKGVLPFSSWPDDLRVLVEAGQKLVKGGYEFDGRTISPLDEQEIAHLARTFAEQDIQHVAISGIFSQINAEQERKAAQIITDIAPDISISLSSELGRTGLIERENAAIMNASLRPLAQKITQAFQKALTDLHIDAPFYISQNDGTLMSADYMQNYPVMTFAAGPTNSLRGAAWLTKKDNAVVVDIGGTTSDIGMLMSGFPRRSAVNVDIGGVRTNFRIPDIYSVGLGGGTIIRNTDGALKIGPDLVGYALLEKAKCFGGDVLTASDIAVASGDAAFGDADKLSDIAPETINNAKQQFRDILSDGIDRMKISAANVPMILVGGGAVLISEKPIGVSEMICPQFAEVANAIGAAIGQISGEADGIYQCPNDTEKEAAIADAQKLAKEKAISSGRRSR